MRGINREAVYARKLKTTLAFKSRFFGSFLLGKKMLSCSPGLFERSSRSMREIIAVLL
ncbi:MAG: hypothetical protein ACYDIA_12525 [Candidatus Humimicrobiaceae bacterium]